MLEEASHKKSGKYLTALHRIIDNAKKTCVEKVATWYARIAKNNDVSMTEAKKMLTASELSEFRWDVKEYVKKAEENELNGKWVKRLENASAKAHISRYDALMLELRAAEEKMYADYVGTVRECLEDVYEDSYLHGMYEFGVKTNHVGAFDNVYVDKNKLDKILRNPWAGDDKIFSDRIWQKKEQLVRDLQTELARNVALGKPPADTIDYIEKKHNVTKKQAQNLVETETAFAHEAAQQDVYEDLDSEQYEILAVLDFKTSKICQEMDGKIFDTKDLLVGTTAPPFHPRCRTTTVSYDELWDGDQDESRAYRGADGKTHWTDSHLTYKEWMEQYVNADPNFKNDYDFKRKSNKNRSADKKQFDKYRETLGAKNVPKTLEEFQKMKYNEPKKWEQLKQRVSQETSKYRYKADEGIFTTLDFRDAKKGRDIIKPHNLRKEMQKSGIGKELMSFLQESDIKVNLCYGTDVPEDLYGYFEEGQINICVNNTKTVKQTASTLIHEATHAKINKPNTKNQEFECYCNEYRHQGIELTETIKKDVKKHIDEKYEYLDWE